MRKKLDYSFAKDWRKSIKFLEISYSDFINILSKSKDKYYLSRKMDGELNSLIYEKGSDPFLLTKSGIVRERDYPLLKEYKQFFDIMDQIQSIAVSGELVAVKGDGHYYPFNESQSIVQTGDVDSVRHFVFDIYKLNGKIIRSDFPTLEKMFHGSKYIQIPKWVYGGVKEFIKLWKEVVLDDDGEGIVAFNPNERDTLYRIKNVLTADVVVVAIGKEGEKAWTKNEMGYMRTAILDKSGSFIMTSKVGTGFSKPFRQNIFKWANKNYIQKIDGDLWIPPKMIIELKYRRHRFTEVPMMKYSKDGYTNIGMVDGGVMLDHTSFVRVRQDKELSYHDLNIGQFPLKHGE